MEKHNYQLEVLVKYAKKKIAKNPLLFIHGAAGGAWYFEHFLEFFSNKGYDAYALSLRGHGNSEGHDEINTFRLQDYVDDVRKIVSTFSEKPIIIGHSMGGAITQIYLGLYQDELEMAILLSSAQAGGIDLDSPLGLFFSDQRTFLRALRVAHPERKITLDDILSETVFSNRFNEEGLKDIKKRLVKESSLVRKDLLSPFIDENKKITVDVSVIGSDGDHIIGEKELLITANFFNTKPVILSRLCHFLTIDPEWKLAAETILKDIERHFRNR